MAAEAVTEEGVAVRGVGGAVSVKADPGVEWREVDRRSTLLEFALDCVPFLDALGAMFGRDGFRDLTWNLEGEESAFSSPSEEVTLQTRANDGLAVSFAL